MKKHSRHKRGGTLRLQRSPAGVDARRDKRRPGSQQDVCRSASLRAARTAGLRCRRGVHGRGSACQLCSISSSGVIARSNADRSMMMGDAELRTRIERAAARPATSRDRHKNLSPRRHSGTPPPPRDRPRALRPFEARRDSWQTRCRGGIFGQPLSRNRRLLCFVKISSRATETDDAKWQHEVTPVDFGRPIGYGSSDPAVVQCGRNEHAIDARIRPQRSRHRPTESPPPVINSTPGQRAPDLAAEVECRAAASLPTAARSSTIRFWIPAPTRGTAMSHRRTGPASGSQRTRPSFRSMLKTRLDAGDASAICSRIDGVPMVSRPSTARTSGESRESRCAVGRVTDSGIQVELETVADQRADLAAVRDAVRRSHRDPPRRIG